MSPRLLLAGFLGLLLLAPMVVSEFHVTLLNYIGLYAIVTLGLVLLTGVGGLMSFGQAAFVGLGAYTTAYLSVGEGLPGWASALGGSPWIGLAAGLVVTAVVALLLGLLTLRLSGHYLPLGTMAWGISLYFLFGNLEFLGGHTGMSGIPVLSLFGIELKESRSFYYVIWVILLAAVWLTQNLLDSREGAGDSCAQGWRRDGRGDGSRYGAVQGGDLFGGGPVCEFLRMAVCPSAAFCESDAVQPEHRHRVPIHGCGGRCGQCLGGRARCRRDYRAQAVAAGLAAETARRIGQF
jgi:hypothetical protein